MPRYIGSIIFQCVFFIALSIASGATNSDPTCATQSKLVESTIAAVSKDLKGEEFCQFRHYQTFGDVDGDGTDDFIVLFSVEGMEGKGNSHYDFMSVFLSGRKWQPITVKTGERGERDPISAEVRGRKIILETVVYRPSDAMCCPSGKGALAYEVSGSQLKLIAETQEQTGRSAPSAHGKTPAR
jgi:hypothetical protein